MRLNKPLYLEKAAVDSLDDTELWIRYLSKYITATFNKITPSMYTHLMNSDCLTREQKRVLKEANIKGSFLNIKVCSLSQKQSDKRLINESTNLPITEKAFNLLNERLKDQNLSLDITCAGGFVLQTLGIRATMDVDAFFNASTKVNSIIESVGEDLGINKEDEVWLNNSIRNMNKEPDSKYKELYRSYSNLNIYMVKPEYLLGMKLKSGREKDFKDVSLLIEKLNLDSPIDLFKKLKEMKFRVDFADILGCFGDALGHKWLASYYKEHGEELMHYL